MPLFNVAEGVRSDREAMRFYTEHLTEGMDFSNPMFGKLLQNEIKRKYEIQNRYPKHYGEEIWLENLFRMSEDVDYESLTTPEAVKKLTNDQYLKFLRRSWPPTNNEWKQVIQTFRLVKSCIIEIALEPFFMKEGSWTWFDDIEMTKLY